jgi:hypothetical protein
VSENLKPGNVKDADEVAGVAHIAIKGAVDALDNPKEEALVHGLG